MKVDIDPGNSVCTTSSCKQTKKYPSHKTKKKKFIYFSVTGSRFQNSVSTRILLSVLSITRETPTTITEDCCVFNLLGPMFDEK